MTIGMISTMTEYCCYANAAELLHSSMISGRLCINDNARDAHCPRYYFPGLLKEEVRKSIHIFANTGYIAHDPVHLSVTCRHVGILTKLLSTV